MDIFIFSLIEHVCAYEKNSNGKLLFPLGDLLAKGKVVWFCNLYINVFFRSVKSHRKARMANQFSCELCPKTFASRRGLNYHKKTHSRAQRHLCSQCGKSFSQSSALKTHSLIHTREKPHKCNQCNYSTNRIGHLKRHILKHT